jgi:hypothetical protein
VADSVADSVAGGVDSMTKVNKMRKMAYERILYPFGNSAACASCFRPVVLRPVVADGLPFRGRSGASWRGRLMESLDRAG